jgi:hypothetical protein
MKLKKHILLIMMLCPAMYAAAVELQIRHEFSLSFGGGRSAVNYKLNEPLFDRNVHLLHGYGGEGVLNYTFFFSKNWGIGTGAGLAWYNSTAVLSGSRITTTGQILQTNQQALNYNLISTLNYFEEQQHLMSFNLPLYMQFQTSGIGNGIYLRFGGKLSFPINASYDIKNASITTDAYFIDAGSSRTDYPSLFNQNEKLPLKVGLMVMAEAGARWNISPIFSLYTGVYFDYGIIVDMQDHRNTAFVDVNYNSMTSVHDPPKTTISSILNARNGANGAELTDIVSPMALGVVLRFALRTDATLYAQEEPAAPEPTGTRRTANTNRQQSTARTTNTTRTTTTTTTTNAGKQQQYVIVQPSGQQTVVSTNKEPGVQLAPLPQYYTTTGQQAYYCPTPAPTATQPYDDTPRPGRRITLEHPSAKPGEETLIQIYDASGVLVHEHLVRGVISTIEIPYKKGTYLIKAGRTIKKVIVE